jgi:hypothetical protein
MCTGLWKLAMCASSPLQSHCDIVEAQITRGEFSALVARTSICASRPAVGVSWTSSMRTWVGVFVLVGCGDTGLLLDVNPGTSEVASIDVVIADAQKASHMGLPMASVKTGGPVWEVVEHVTATVEGGAHARILLQPGSLGGAPTLLVLGYDGHHNAIRFAQLPAVTFPHTHSDTIKLTLDPITEVPAAGSTAGTPTGAKLVRWSKTPDDNTGDCIAVLTDNGSGHYGGDFFGPGSDLDCDQADPECDDTWYLKTPAAGSGSGSAATSCARNDRTPDTMDVCRVGKAIACTDNVGDCSFAAVSTNAAGAPCAPSTLCDNCNDQIATSCLQTTIESENTVHIDCTLPAGLNAGSAFGFCANGSPTFILDTGTSLSTAFQCAGGVTFWPLSFAGASAALPLNGAATAALTATCSTQGPGINFSVTGFTTATVDSSLASTEAMMAITTANTAAPHTLMIPIIVHLVSDCTMPSSCTLVQGVDNGQAFTDTMWKCL